MRRLEYRRGIFHLDLPDGPLGPELMANAAHEETENRES
jgi:hypothetical protein